MKKILFVATVAEHFFYFHLPCFKMFKDKGWQVDVACHATENFRTATINLKFP